MKKWMMMSAFGLAVINAAACVYLYQRQNQTEGTVTADLLKSIAERQQIAEGLQRELANKRKDQEFVLQQERARQLQEFQLQIDELTAALEASDTRREESVKLLDAGHTQLGESMQALEGRIAAQSKQNQLKTDTRLEELDTARLQFSKDLTHLAETLREQMTAFNQRVSEIKGSLSDYDRRLAEYRSLLQAPAGESTAVAPPAAKAAQGD